MCTNIHQPQSRALHHLEIPLTYPKTHVNSKTLRKYRRYASTTSDRELHRQENGYTLSTAQHLEPSSSGDAPLSSPPLPKHLAVIMDGNSRWARQRSLPTFSGHQSGVESMRKTVQFCIRRGIRALTVYCFSHENWHRDTQEVDFLLTLIEKVVSQELDELLRVGTRLKFIGDRTALPPSMIDLMVRAEAATEDNDTLYLNVALSYSGRRDVIQAIREIARLVKEGTLQGDDVDEDTVSKYLGLGHLPPDIRDPDLLIRTSGEQRLSNFLLWDIAYSELVFLPVLWPDLAEDDLEAAVAEFGRRERRFGKH